MPIEIVGTAAAIIQLAQVGFQLVQTLYNLSDDISSAKDQVKELASYVKSTSVILEEVGKVFEEEGTSSHPVISQNAISTANDVVAKCQAFFDKLNDATKKAKKDALGPLKLILKGQRLQKLQVVLEKSKSDLQLMMLIIIEARVRVGNKELNSRGSDIDEIVRAIKENRKASGQYKDAELELGLEEHKEPQEKNRLRQEEKPAKDGATPSPCSSTPIDPAKGHGVGCSQSHEGNVTIAATVLPQETQQANHTNARPTAARSLGDQTPLERPEPDDPRPPLDLDEPRQSYEEETDISYWSALKLVCFPCLGAHQARGQKRSRRDSTAPDAAATTRHGDRLLMQYMAPDHPEVATGINSLTAIKRSTIKSRYGEVKMKQLLHEWTTIYNDEV